MQDYAHMINDAPLTRENSSSPDADHAGSGGNAAAGLGYGAWHVRYRDNGCPFSDGACRDTAWMPGDSSGPWEVFSRCAIMENKLLEFFLGTDGHEEELR
jgi:hypothetical protein